MSKESAGTASVRSGGGSRIRAGSRRTAKRSRAADGLETGADGSVIGRDPRQLSPDELRALGHRGKPLLQAMRRRCIDCCGGKSDEVRRCTAVACPLWPYRMGTDPWHTQPAKPATPDPAPVTRPTCPIEPLPRRGRAAEVAQAPLLPLFGRPDEE